MKNLKYIYRQYYNFILLFFIILSIFSCKSKTLNYVEYYNKVYDIDSTHRADKDTLATIKNYRKLFRKYPPVQNERIEEYETYIKLADQYGKRFGGKKSLDKLIVQAAPNWKYKREDAEFFKLYKKYGIDSLEVEQKVTQWKKSLNQRLIDSFSIAFQRDQYNGRIYETPGLKEKDDQNAELLLWTLKNYGFPSLQKIGLYGNNNLFMPMGVLLNHMAQSEHYEYFKIKLVEYVKSGECVPRDYMDLVDKHQYINYLETEYGIFQHADDLRFDTIKINKRRKEIGFPSLKKSVKIGRDFNIKNRQK
ncbi:hypothetical protein ODZ84_17165 [Chryseobacterium fluminis]|uniref:hypothetical protein n=1 Tax=Chryseobacterium fluminis TaxID=2983606 RepID=UPI0022530594|nr:hypothetical protein [Chryseobacterium sp. MMS21-Ot14]UZT96932.1 hypothetical protein ODZ84_17165 [Chryseobacterium sp. MMS21-Ot14]